MTRIELGNLNMGHSLCFQKHILGTEAPGASGPSCTKDRNNHRGPCVPSEQGEGTGRLTWAAWDQRVLSQRSLRPPGRGYLGRGYEGH